MTPAQARELFSEAHEGSLPPDQWRQFEALLERDETLAREYRDFAQMLELMAARARALGRAPAPNLLPGVQRRLRQRYRGRYFRDRFAQKVGSGALNPWLLGAAMLGLVLLSWLVLWWFGTAQPFK